MFFTYMFIILILPVPLVTEARQAVNAPAAEAEAPPADVEDASEEEAEEEDGTSDEDRSWIAIYTRWNHTIVPQLGKQVDCFGLVNG